MTMCNGNCTNCIYYRQAESIKQNVTETVNSVKNFVTENVSNTELSVIEPTEKYKVVKTITGKLVAKKVKDE